MFYLFVYLFVHFYRELRYTFCYLGSIKIMGKYCVGRAQTMLLGSIKIIGAYCEGRVQAMLRW